MTLIEAQAGQPLDYVFPTSYRPQGLIEEQLDHHHDYQYAMEMRIQGANGLVVLYENRGMHEGLTDDGTLVIAVSIHDAGYLGEGEHPFMVHAEDAHGVALLDDAGTIRVAPADGSPNRREEVRPWDLLDPKEPRVEKAERDARYAVCKACDRLHMGVCAECKCVMRWKTTLANATCPIGKW